MNKEDYASIKWVRKLGHLFPNAEYGFEHTDGLSYRCITIQMLLDKLPEVTIQTTFIDEYFIYYKKSVNLSGTNIVKHYVKNKSLINALCEMLDWIEEN